MLFHIGIEMEPFRRDDGEDFLQEIIGQGSHGEYDGSEYLNDTGDGDDGQPKEMVVQDVSAEVYGILLIYINICMNSVYMYNVY